MTPWAWAKIVPGMIKNIRGQEFFVKHPDHWFILFVDGLDSHIMYPEALKLFLDAKIWVLKMPSHTSHILQPLDLGFFRWEKEEFKLFLRDFCIDYPFEELDVWDTVYCAITASIAIAIKMRKQIRYTFERANIYPHVSLEQWFVFILF